MSLDRIANENKASEQNFVRSKEFTKTICELVPGKLEKLIKTLTLPFAGIEYAFQDVERILSKIDKERSIRYWKNWLKRTAPLTSGIIAAAPLSLLTHELLHSVTNKVFGGVNYQLYISPFFGGNLINKIIPYITTNSEIAKIDDSYFLGVAYMGVHYNSSPFEWILMSLTPYSLSALGVHLVNKGIKEEDLFKTGIGVSLTAPLLSNWNHKDEDLAYVARQLLDNAIPSISKITGDDAYLVGGLILASAIYALSAKASDALLTKTKTAKTFKKSLWKKTNEYSISVLASLAIIAGLSSFSKPLQTTKQERISLLTEKLNSLQKVYSREEREIYSKKICELQKEFPEFNIKQYSNMNALKNH